MRKIILNKVINYGILLLITYYLTLNTSYSQTWQPTYEKFAQEYQSQNFTEAITTGNQLLTEIGTKDTNYASVLQYIAYANYSIQNYEKAIENYKEASDLYRQLIGKENYTYILSIYNLAINYSIIKKNSLAYPLLDEVINFIIKDQTKNSMDYINTAVQEASIYNTAGSYEKAAEIYEDVFEVVKANYSETDSMYIQMVNTIAPFYYVNGQFERAEPFYTNAVDLMEKTYGKLSVVYITTLNSLGEFYLGAGMYNKAEKVYLEFEELCGKFYGKNSADYATSLNNLAVAYEKQEKYPEAETTYLKSLKIKEKVFKKESNFYVLTLINLAVVYDYMARFDEAEKLLNEALEIYKKINKDDKYNYSIALNSLASIYSSNGDYKKALELLNIAEEIQKNYGDKNDAYINTINSLAIISEQLGNYNEAEKYSERATQLRKEALGEKHTDYATSLMGLAQLKIIQGKYVEAKQLLDKSLEIQKNAVGEYSSQYFKVLNSIAGLYSYMGNYQLAQFTYENCKTLAENIYGDMHPEYATFLNNYGLFFYESGNYEMAEKYLNQSLQISIDAFGKDHPDNVNMLMNLSNTMLAQGNNKKAEEYLIESVDITKKKLGTEHPQYASTLMGLGIFYYETGNYDKAEKNELEAAEKKKQIFGEKSSEYSTAMSNLGSLYLSKAIFSETDAEIAQNTLNAEKHLVASVKVDSSTIGTEHPDYATHLNNLAEFYRNTGQLDKAEPIYLKVVDIEKKIFGEKYIGLATTYHNMALNYAGFSNFKKAIEYGLLALEIKESALGKDNPFCTETMSSLAYIYEFDNNPEEAEKYYTKAVQLNYELLKNNFSFLSEEEKTKYLKTISYTNDMFNSFAAKRYGSNHKISELAYNNEIINKGILLRSTNSIRNAVLQSKNPELIEKYDNWIGIKQQLSQLYTQPADSRFEKPEELEEKANLLEKELVVQSADIKNSEDIFKTDWTIIKKQLKENEAAIEFTHYKRLEYDNSNTDNYCALIILPSQDSPLIINLFEAKQIEAILGNFAGNNLDYISKIYGNKSGHNSQLYDLIWKPIDSVLTGINTVYFSPAGLLHKIAFSAIKTSENIYLSDKYALNSLSSTQLITEKSSNNILAKNINIDVFGGAQFTTDNSKQEIWKYLAGTKSEANSINKIFIENKIESKEFEGLSASEENLKSLDGKNSPKILHIATHGFFYPDPKEITAQAETKTESGDISFRGGSLAELSTYSKLSKIISNPNPLMRSGLALTGANNSLTDGDKEDGILTAYEVSNMNLQNTQLVVMSACETGLGDIKGSEGVYGLQRAFKMAGAKFLIMSLWQVPDKETSEFMTSFYTRLLKLKDIRKSFNETQTEMRKKYDPYYWAAFVLVE